MDGMSQVSPAEHYLARFCPGTCGTDLQRARLLRVDQELQRFDEPEMAEISSERPGSFICAADIRCIRLEGRGLITNLETAAGTPTETTLKWGHPPFDATPDGHQDHPSAIDTIDIGLDARPWHCSPTQGERMGRRARDRTTAMGPRMAVGQRFLKKIGPVPARHAP